MYYDEYPQENSSKSARMTLASVDNKHDPLLYSNATIAEKLKGLDAIDDEAYRRYREDGFIAIDDAFTSEQVRSWADALVGLIMGENPEFNFIQFEAKSQERLDTLNSEERQDAVRKLYQFSDYHPALKELSVDPRIIAIATRIIGEPVKMIQDMALIKPPRVGSEKPWHQDKAFFDYPLEFGVVGFWIALDESTIENGCMHLLPGLHKKGPIPHFRRRDWQICDTVTMGNPCVATPLRPGGVLVFDGMIPHGTPANHSPLRRKAIQLHFAGVSSYFGSREERLLAFGRDLQGVTC